MRWTVLTEIGAFHAAHSHLRRKNGMETGKCDMNHILLKKLVWACTFSDIFYLVFFAMWKGIFDTLQNMQVFLNCTQWFNISLSFMAL